MGRAQRAVGDQLPAQPLYPPLQGEVDAGSPAYHAVYGVQIFAGGQIERPGGQLLCAQQDHRQSLSGETRPARRGGPDNILQQSQPAYDGGRVDGSTLAFVVQADVAADHRDAQCPTGPRHATDALLQLIIDFGTLRIAEIQAIGERQGFRADAGEVARDLGHRQLAAPEGVQVALPAVPVDGDGDGGVRFLDAEDRRIAGAGADNRVGLHLVVVLLVHPRSAGDIGRSQQLPQGLPGVVGQGDLPEVEALPGQRIIRGLAGQAVARRVRQVFDGQGGDGLRTVLHLGELLFGYGSDGPAGDVPLLEHVADGGHVLRRSSQQHPLLRFR